MAGFGLAGCVGQMESEEPGVAKVDEQKLILAELPDVLLVRRVVLQETATEIFAHGKARQVDEVRSDLGEVGEVADLDCVVDGLKSVLPESEIVPAERFWARVVGDGEEVRLPALFEPPLASRWYDLDVDFLVAAYHHELDAEGKFHTLLFMSLYGDASRQMAAGVTVDVPNQTTLNAARAMASEDGTYGHVFMYPIVVTKSAASEPCEVIGEVSAAAISEHSGARRPRVLVLAAGADPYAAAQAAGRAEAQDKQAQDKPARDEQAPDEQAQDEQGLYELVQ